MMFSHCCKKLKKASEVGTENLLCHINLSADCLVQRRAAHHAQWQAPDGSSSGRSGQSSSACDPTRRRRRVHSLRLQHEGKCCELREAVRGAFRSRNSPKIHVTFINAENQVGPKGRDSETGAIISRPKKLKPLN